MIKPGEIQQTAGRLGLRDTQIEKDYVIGWVLKGISENEYLKNNIIFKGGTALRKIYFPDFRISEDLDFSVTSALNTDKIKENFEAANDWVYEDSRIRLSIEVETLHETGNYNFYLKYTGPLGGKNKEIKVDISGDEKICSVPFFKKVNNPYSDLEKNYKVLVYPLSEIIVEKMRSLMQRTMPRDLYDLWYLFENEAVNIEDYIFDFIEKAEYKGYNPNELIEIINKKENIFERLWNENLVNQMQDVPDFSDVWRELGRHWRKFEKFIIL